MTDNCWDILGIDPINDERAIKKAYARKLKDNKPDKNPAGFKALREAYEQALLARHWIDDRFFDDESLDNEVIKEHDNEYLDNESSDYEPLNSDSLTSSDGFNSTHNHNKTDNRNDTGKMPAPISSLEIKIDGELVHFEHINSTVFDSSSYDASSRDADPLDTAPLDSPAHEDVGHPVDMGESGYGNPLQSQDFQSQDLPTPDLQNQWYQAWQRSLNPAISDGTDAADNNHRADNNTSQDSADARLHDCLQRQFEALRQYPLDTVDDYEQSLITWFDEQQMVLPQAYALAKKHFNWQEHIDTWDSYEYPWYLVNAIDKRYAQVAHFSTLDNFKTYLAGHYPLVYEQMDFDLPADKVPSHWRFVRKLKWAHLGFPLRQQFDALELELTSHHSSFPGLPACHQAADEQAIDWLSHPQLVALRQRLENFGIIGSDDVVIILIVCMIAFYLLNLPLQFFSFADGFTSAILISLFCLYWQLQLNYFANPFQLTLSQELRTGWRSASLVIWAILTSQLPSVTHADGFYIVAHLVGFSALLSLNTDAHSIAYRYALLVVGILLLGLALLPAIIGIATALPPDKMSTLATVSPFMWLFVLLPPIFGLLGSKIKLFSSLSESVAGLIIFSTIPLTWLLTTTGADTFLQSDMYLSAVLFTIAVVMIPINMFKAINFFGETSDS